MCFVGHDMLPVCPPGVPDWSRQGYCTTNCTSTHTFIYLTIACYALLLLLFRNACACRRTSMFYFSVVMQEVEQYIIFDHVVSQEIHMISHETNSTISTHFRPRAQGDRTCFPISHTLMFHCHTVIRLWRNLLHCFLNTPGL